MSYCAAPGPLTILVVEDSECDFFLIKEFLLSSRLLRTTIHHATTLADALDYLMHNKPHLVFLDLFLPDSHGLESFNRLKTLTGTSAVIVLSGLSDMKTSLEAITLGAEDYLTKGEFDEKLLEKTVAYAIERRRNIEKLHQANERYKLVTKATHDLIWDWDLLTGEMYRDEYAVKSVYGVDGTTIQDVHQWNSRIHPEDADQLFRLIEEMKNSAEINSFELEYRFLCEAGYYKNIYDRIYVVRNAEGRSVRLIGAAQDITEKRKLEKALIDSRLRQQKIVTAATIKGQENERQQLGRELHDNINQMLAASVLYLDHALTTGKMDKDKIVESRELIVMATCEIRKLSHKLLPPALEGFGLLKALDELVRPVAITGSLKVNKQWEFFPEQIWQHEQKLTIYRIVQEQLNNILKHASAKNVCISLSLVRDKSVAELLITDDGKGFDTRLIKNGVGLRNIRSRAELFEGNVSLYSRPGFGCRLNVTFPYSEETVTRVA